MTVVLHLGSSISSRLIHQYKLFHLVWFHIRSSWSNSDLLSVRYRCWEYLVTLIWPLSHVNFLCVIASYSAMVFSLRWWCFIIIHLSACWCYLCRSDRCTGAKKWCSPICELSITGDLAKYHLVGGGLLVERYCRNISLHTRPVLLIFVFLWVSPVGI